MSNNKYELKDYPCLYYLVNKLDHESMCKFFVGLGTIFGMNASDISKSSILFAGATKILFNGKGYSKEEILKYGESIFKKPFSNCNVLCRWNIVKKYDLPKNCCIACPLSKEYKNARIECEQMNLRTVIHTGKLSGHDSNKFYSVVSIKPGNDISNYPLIPLLSMLNQYFIDDNPCKPYDDKEALINSFSEYVCGILNYSDPTDKKAVLDCVKREINYLYDFDFSMLNSQVMHTIFIGLVSSYEYRPPKIMTPSSTDDVPTIIPAKKKNKRNYSSPNQELLIPIDKPDKDESQKNKKKEETKSNVKSGSKATKSNDNTKYDKNNTECIYNVYNNGIKHDKDTKAVANAAALSSISSLSYPEYSISDSLAKNIIYCTADDPKSVLAFITDICSSQYVSVESVLLKSRHGLLFMTAHSRKFYFYDLEYAPSGYLYPALSDASNLRFLSLNPIPVISMFHKLGFNSLRIESLCSLYWIYNQEKDIIDYIDMFRSILTVKNENNEDFYSFYMQYYEQFYSIIMDKINSEQIEKYKHGIKFEQVLGGSYDLSDILYGMTNSISGQGFLNYNFNYNNDIPYIKKGILYVVNIPELKEKNKDNISEFFETIAIKVHKSPMKCVRYAKLITFTNNGIVYYSTMQGDMFFDILLDTVRKTYTKFYEGTPVLKTYRVVYK